MIEHELLAEKLVECATTNSMSGGLWACTTSTLADGIYTLSIRQPPVK
jgi:hypothetical protein